LEQIFQNVIINRQELNSIEFEKESIEIPLSPGGEETFEILITNHGSPTHIHLSVSEDLKGLITFLRDNPYVLQKEYISAVARIPQEGRVLTRGQIFITAGYGSRKKGFPVQLGKAVESKTQTKPQIYTREESFQQEEQEDVEPQTSLVTQPVKKSSRSKSGSGLGLSSIFKGFKGNHSASTGRKNQKNAAQNEKPLLNIAFGSFLLLVALFFLYFILPESLQFRVSFPQSLLFSILFVTFISYILIKILEEA